MPDRCPHCQHELPAAAGSRPARCPQCEQPLQPTHSASLASLLRPERPARLPSQAPVVPISTTSLHQASPGPGDDQHPTGIDVQPSGPATGTPADDAVAVEPPHEAAETEPTVDDATTPAVAIEAAQAPASKAMEHEAAPEQLASAPDDDAAVPSFTRRPRARASRRTPAWQWAAVIVLGVALILQALIADRSRLAQDAQWRPLLTSLCGALGCTLPPWREPQAYTMLARDVRPAPGRPGVLQVRATFRNDARWPQAWPSVGLSLSDADGRIAGARVLVPDDYLAQAQQDTTLAPGQSGQLSVQIREPKGGVVAFAFDFH